MKKSYPRSRQDNLVVQEVDGEVMIYDLVDNKAFCLNNTCALVWQLCDGHRSLPEISSELSKKLNSPASEGLVWLALEQLKKDNLIENEVKLPTEFLGMSRREVIRKVGFGTMIALPIVASLIAPTGAMAASCVAYLGTCSPTGPSGTMCCSPSPAPNCVNTPAAQNQCCKTTGTIIGTTATPNVNGSIGIGFCGPSNPTTRDSICDSNRGPLCCSGNASSPGCTGLFDANFSCACAA